MQWCRRSGDGNGNTRSAGCHMYALCCVKASEGVGGGRPARTAPRLSPPPGPGRVAIFHTCTRRIHQDRADLDALGGVDRERSLMTRTYAHYRSRFITTFLRPAVSSTVPGGMHAETTLPPSWLSRSPRSQSPTSDGTHDGAMATGELSWPVRNDAQPYRHANPT
jgi:hypothetical protein